MKAADIRAMSADEKADELEKLNLSFLRNDADIWASYLRYVERVYDYRNDPLGAV